MLENVYNNHERKLGLAACSVDCDTMWQIGIDVLQEYRRRGVASSLTSNLAIKILNRGKVPFYCCAWAEMTVKPERVVADMNC